MEVSCSFLYTLLVLSLATIFHVLFKKHKRIKSERRVAKLPPGSMGWPYIGETHHLYAKDPNVFFATKQKRYGEIFKTHVLGCPCVMLASPEAAKFVLANQLHLFKPTYPRSKERLIGPWALFFHQGDYHSRLRRLVQATLSLDAIRGLVGDIEGLVISLLRAWDGHVVSTFRSMKKLSFDVGILMIFGGDLDDGYKQELKRKYFIVDKGYNSFPTSIPGTLYHKAIQARKQLRAILSEIMSERRKKGAVGRNDLLGCLMDSEDEKGGRLSDDQVADNIIGVLFAAQDTTASTLAWIFKFLHDTPKLLDAVKEEQMAIFEANGCGSQPLTWAQTRSMVLTHKVILETLRMASIISFTFREAVTDVQYKDYLIPKGWKVMPLFRNIHHNPDFFPDPHKFDPSRFMTSPKPNTFLPFGYGVHACPGNELAKLEILIVIHHLVTKYRLEVFGSHNEVEHSPFPVPKHGLLARLRRSESDPPAHRCSCQ